MKLAVCLLAALFTGAENGYGYRLEGPSWPSGTVLVVQLSLGNANRTLQDGNTSWNGAVAPVIAMWNQQIGRVQTSAVMDSPAPVSSGDHVNSVAFSSNAFGQSFGSNTLAITMYRYSGGVMSETDTVFNLAITYDSYRGPLQFGSNGYAIPDIRRVFLHELGHGIGLGHPDTGGQQVDAVMNSVVSDRAVLSADDIAGGQSLYGAPTGPPPATSHLANISTRLRVGVGDNVLIGGFIITGSSSKTVLFRATGPSLVAAGIAGALADPTLELHDSTGGLIASNDNWQASAQASAMAATGLAPSNPLESAILATLAPGSYTAVVQGTNGTSGVGLIEAYEIGADSAKLANIATRGHVGTGDDVLIGGTIVTGGTSKSVMVRAIGPSLANYIAGALIDPVLELRDGSGNLIAANDNWNTGSQYSQIVASGLAPTDPRESAIVATISPGSYTAIVQGAGGTSGVALVEVYDLDP